MDELPVRLRKFEEKDAAALYRFRNDDRISGSLGGFSTGYSHTDLLNWIERHRGARDEVLWAIAGREDDLCVGHVGLYAIDHRVRKAEFGIVIGNAALHGRGLGKAITSWVLAYGFDALNLHRISLSLLAANERAWRLYGGLGFREEGRLRDEDFRGGRYGDVVLMGLLADEWRADRP